MSLQEFIGYNINLSTSANLIINSTNSNLNATTLTVANSLITSGLRSIFNSNTLGNLFTTGGNIGINTTAPVFRLDVGGVIKTGNSVASNFTSFDNIIITPLTGQTNTTISFNNVASTRNYIYTTSPGGMQIGGHGALGFNTGTSAGTVSTYMTLTSGGNLGIGTATPSALLDVNGSIEVLGNSNTIGNIFTTGGNVGINTIPAFRLDVAGTSRIVGSGAGQTNGSLLVTGSDAFGHTLCIASSANTNKRTVLNHSGTVGSLFSFDYSAVTPQNLCLQSPGGNVGIGTSTPSVKLDLGTTAAAQILALFNNNGPGGYYGFGAINSTNYYMSGLHHQFFTGSGFGTTGTSVMYINSSGQVGINTTSPGDSLTVNNAIRTFGSTGILNFHNAAQSTRFGYLYHGGTSMELCNQLAGDMFFSTNNGEKMRISSSGNVGINQSVPGVPLHIGSGAVNGDVRGTVSLFVPYKDIECRWLYLGWGDASEARISTDTATKPITFSINDTERMRIGTGGNVGIGITNPTQMLHIQKSGTDNYIKVDSGGTGTNYSGIMLSEYNINYGWSLRQHAFTDLLHISYQDNTPSFTDLITFDRVNNRMGINNTAPTTSLDVNGSIKGSSYNGVTTTFSGVTTVDITFDVTNYRKVEVDVAIDFNTSGGQLYINTTSNTELGEDYTCIVQHSSPGTRNTYTDGRLFEAKETNSQNGGTFTTTIYKPSVTNGRTNLITRGAYCWAGVGLASTEHYGQFSGSLPTQFRLRSNNGTMSGSYTIRNYN